MYVLYFFLKRVETGKTVDLVECIYTSGATLFLMATTATASTTTIHINVLEGAPCLKIHQNCAILGGRRFVASKASILFICEESQYFFEKRFINQSTFFDNYVLTVSILEGAFTILHRRSHKRGWFRQQSLKYFQINGVLGPPCSPPKPIYIASAGFPLHPPLQL